MRGMHSGRRVVSNANNYFNPLSIRSDLKTQLWIELVVVAATLADTTAKRKHEQRLTHDYNDFISADRDGYSSSSSNSSSGSSSNSNDDDDKKNRRKRKKTINQQQQRPLVLTIDKPIPIIDISSQASTSTRRPIVRENLILSSSPPSLLLSQTLQPTAPPPIQPTQQQSIFNQQKSAIQPEESLNLNNKPPPPPPPLPQTNQQSESLTKIIDKTIGEPPATIFGEELKKRLNTRS